MPTCAHDQGFYNSAEGLKRCKGCHRSYEVIRAEENASDNLAATPFDSRYDYDNPGEDT